MIKLNTNTVGKIYHGNNEARKVFLGDTLVYGDVAPEHAYITFTSSGTNTVEMECNGTAAPVLYYSTDKRTWTRWDYSALTVTDGHPIYMYGNNPTVFSSSAENYARFVLSGLTGYLSCSGDLMALVDDSGTADTIPCSYYFYDLFSNGARLRGTPSISATNLKSYCYYQMFYRCSNIVSAPDLPATNLATRCYYSMFNRCSKLVNVPSILPAMTLESYCYDYMFYGCSSLVTAPVLPALTLVGWCYGNMFRGCSSLNYIKAMFTTTPSQSYTSSWVDGVAESGTFVKNSAAQWNVEGVSGIPAGWTVETASS